MFFQNRKKGGEPMIWSWSELKELIKHNKFCRIVFILFFVLSVLFFATMIDYFATFHPLSYAQKQKIEKAFKKLKTPVLKFKK